MPIRPIGSLSKSRRSGFAACQIRSFHASRSVSFEFSTVLQPVHHALQSAHAYTGLPWYIMIPLATVTLRATVTLPISILNRKRAQKQASLQPLLQAMTPVLKAKLAASSAAQSGKLTIEQINVIAMKERRKRRVALFKKFKCQSWKSIIILPMIQIPLWATMSLVIRSMCGWQVMPGIPKESAFIHESFLWLPNLTEADPYGILPVCIGVFALANVEWNALVAMNPTAVAIRNRGKASVPVIFSNISRIATLLFMTASFQAPTAVCLYWLSSNAFSLGQNLMLDRYLPIRYSPQHSAVKSDVIELQSNSACESTEKLKEIL